ncbi:MAG: hypothetical protein KJT03_15935, partial [Verrucomicrobiae bacterium]|nr:hypothetical protein [Verrucomicrobiae bacterium]
WTGMLFGPLEPFVNVFSDWPVDDTAVDAVILISETIQADDFRFAKLKSYLNEGGNLLVFGKPADALSVILPVEVAEKKPWIENPQYIQTGTAGPWSGFEVNNGPSHYGIKLKANAGSEILANWEDGTPAVVLGKYGRGTVVYVGSGSGQVWQKRPELEGADEMALRLVYWMAKGKFSIDAALKQAEDIYRQNRAEDIALRDWVLEESDEEKPEHFAVISKRNAGRFGWQIEEGGLVDNLRSNGQVSPPMTRHFQFRGSRDEVDREAAFRLKPGSVSEEPEVGEVKQSWFSKTISWNFENGESIQSTLSLGSPAILWEGSSNTIDLDVSGITHLAYVTGQGVQIHSVDKPIPASELAEGWLLLFRARGDVRDMPLLVVLTRGPQEIKYDGGLLVSFNEGGFASLFTMRLFGIRRFASGETMAWEKGIPSEAIQAARLWNQRLLQFQVDCVEIAWRENNAIQIANRFRYQEIKSDWPVHPATLAPLPPVLSLALEAGAPVQLPGNTQDLNCATKYGPLQAVEGDFTKITIPIPPQDHRAIIPVKGRMELQDKIDRLTSGLALGTKNYNDNIRGPGEGDLQADLHPYDISKALPYNEAPNIDTYKFWLTFNSLLARPVYSPAIREAVDRHNWERYRETLNFYSHKCFVMRKREPLSGVEYLITFVWPTNTYSGFRSFHDANEASGVNAYCFTNYARYYGDWTTLEANWNHCRRLWEFLPRVNDWACMASGALEYWQVAGLDMLNSEPYGNFAYAYAARQAGYPGEELLAQTLGAKSMVAAVSRFALESYLASITGAGDPWREFL